MRNQRRWRLAAAGALGLIGVTAHRPAQAVETYRRDLLFQSRNQSAWGPGPGVSYNWEHDLGFNWDLDSGSLGGFWNPEIDLVLDTISLGETGAEVRVSTKGRAGLRLGAQVDTGTVNADYPVRLKIEYPDNGTLYPGDTYTVKTSWERYDKAKLWSSGPRLRFNADAYFKAQNKVQLRAAIAGSELVNTNLLGSGVFADLDINEPIISDFDTNKDIGGGFRFPQNYPGFPTLSLSWKVPHLSGEGELLASASGNRLEALARDNFLGLDGSISNIFFPSTFDDGFDIGVLRFYGHYELLNLYMEDFNLDVQQRFALNPNPTIDLPLPGGETVKIKIGESVTRIYPSVEPGTARNDVSVAPTVRLRNGFISRTDLVLAPRLYLKPFYFSAEGGLDIPYIGGFDFGPWEFDPIDSVNVPYQLGLIDNPEDDLTFNLLEKNYELGGFNTETPSPFTIQGYTYPVPVLSAVAPIMIQQHSPATVFAFTGSEFVPAHGTLNPSTKVHWNGPSSPSDRTSERATTFVSANQLLGVLTKEDLSVEAIHYVTVFNPAPGGGASAKLPVMVDGTPPAFTAAANPPAIDPPNGKMIPVTISGKITDNMVGVDLSTPVFTVKDEYGKVEPSGKVTLAADGSYSFTIMLEARRNGTDTDGRDYTVTLSAVDKVKNASSHTFKINVAHSQGNGQGPK